MFGRSDELPAEDLVGGTPLPRHTRAELHDRQADFGGTRRGWHRSSERDGHGIRHSHRPLPEEPAALEAENAAPHAIEMDGNHRHVETLDHPLEAALERQEVPGPADRPFREHADRSEEHTSELQSPP